MSLLVIAAMTAAVAASVGYLASRRRGGEEEAARGGEAARKHEPVKKQEPARSPFEGLPLKLGDVVSAGGEERWLAGAIVARERDEVVAVLFLAPEGAALGAVAVFAPPRKDIYWMAPAEVESPAEPPATLEIGGAAMRRRGRLPVALERLGQGAPRVGEEGVVASYEGGPSEVAMVLGSEGKVYAWAGRRIEDGEYERLGEGGDG
ncbi:MAG: hypothetical protein IT372_09960 [Polyangiaceae bacterium]|nr:hypothetical protein [Polyangiaceae bacterium]